MNYNALIRNWHNKAKDSNGKDYFSKYVFEYLSFIAYLKTQLFHNTNDDRNAIQKLKQTKEIKDKYFQIVQPNSSVQKVWDEIINELEKKPLVNVSRNPHNSEDIKWWNCSRNDVSDKTEEEKRKQKGVVHSLDDWENMVEFWCSIRNNLFHASKNPENKRDQRLVKYGYRTLSELIEIFVDEHKN